MHSLPARIALVTHTLPPKCTGHPLLLWRLFRDIDPSGYCIVTNRSSVETPGVLTETSVFGGCQYSLPPEWGERFARMHFLWRFSPQIRFPCLIQETLRRAKRILPLLLREQCQCVISFSGSLCNLPATCLAAKWAGIPYGAYILDYYSKQWTRPSEHRYAAWWEPRLIRDARAVIVPNEGLRDIYARRYGVAPQIIRNPCEFFPPPDAAPPDTFHPPPSCQAQSAPRLVYTGAIYEAHYDAFATLLRALERLGPKGTRLHVYTTQSHETLRNHGIQGPVELHPPVTPEEAFRLQCNADILYLPLAFRSAIPEVVATSLPLKFGEYLASGRPILCHAPPDSFAVEFVRRHECGVTVDTNDPAVLAATITNLLGDKALQQKICQRAVSLARREFSVESARAGFLNIVEAAVK